MKKFMRVPSPAPAMPNVLDPTKASRERFVNLPLPLDQIRRERIWSSGTRPEGVGQESPTTLGRGEGSTPRFSCRTFPVRHPPGGHRRAPICREQIGTCEARPEGRASRMRRVNRPRRATPSGFARESGAVLPWPARSPHCVSPCRLVGADLERPLGFFHNI